MFVFLGNILQGEACALTFCFSLLLFPLTSSSEFDYNTADNEDFPCVR